MNKKDRIKVTEPKFGVKYDLYEDKKFVGTATWTDDRNHGPVFLGDPTGKGGSRLVYFAQKYNTIYARD